MNLHQFRFVQEAVRRNLNLTETAKALHTSQPGVSKAIIELEEELGIEIFARHGKRLKRVTEPGQQVLKSIELIMREVTNLRRIGDEFSSEDSGTLSIATTHTQARYVLPEPVAKLRLAYPKVNVSLHQGSPTQVAQMLIDEVAEIGIATESLDGFEELVSLPCYEWQHVLVLPAGHPLCVKEHLTLEDIAHEPLITYHPSYTGRTKIDQAFAMACKNLDAQFFFKLDDGFGNPRLRRVQGLGCLGQVEVAPNRLLDKSELMQVHAATTPFTAAGKAICASSSTTRASSPTEGCSVNRTSG